MQRREQNNGNLVDDHYRENSIRNINDVDNDDDTEAKEQKMAEKQYRKQRF